MSILEMTQLACQKASIKFNNMAATAAKWDESQTRRSLERTQKRLARLRNKLVKPLPQRIETA
jgi:hypothetical protein